MFTKLVSGLVAFSSLAQALPSPPARSALEARTQVKNQVWCGPVLAASAQTVSAEWIVPEVSKPSSSNGDDIELYQWVGIDGYGGSCPDALLQIGTAQRWIDNAWSYSTWMEYYTPDNKPSQHYYDPPVSPGDSVRATVVANSSTSGTVTLENLTTGTSKSWDLEAVGNYPLCFEHVEWINEAPTNNLPTFPNMDFTSLSYTDWDGNSYNAAGSDLAYLDQTYAVCSATLSSDGNTASFTEALPN